MATGLMPIPDAVPVPESDTVCGLELLLSLMFRVSLRLPAAVGVKVTLIFVPLPGVTLIGSVPAERAKSAAFKPVMLKLEINRSPFPELLTAIEDAALVVFTAWLVNVTLVGSITGTGAVAVPDRATVCGLPVALSLIFSVAARFPPAIGANFTVIMVLPPGTTVLGVDKATKLKSEAFVPEIAILEITRFPIPGLLTVTPNEILPPTN